MRLGIGLAIVAVLVGGVGVGASGVVPRAIADILSPSKVKLAVIAPKDPTRAQSLDLVVPIVELAVKTVEEKGFLPGRTIEFVERDSNCSSTTGPLAAFELHSTTDAFIGPVCDYVLAPVARYAGAWKIPVLTAGGQAYHFIYKSEFPTLTRLMGSYGDVSEAVKVILADFHWSTVGLLYHNYGVNSNKGYSECHFMLGPVFTALGHKSIHRSFNDSATSKDFEELLKIFSGATRIVVVCADPATVREILLVAEELEMMKKGEYVFFNIELFDRNNTHRPWFVSSDSEERNTRAKRAYEALLTITAKTPDDENYKNFSDKVKSLALERHNFTFGPDPVSTFVTAFYDAVLLYAIALNETLEDGGTQKDGANITRRMWNRTFTGITGNVNIDGNGDRTTDYSLLDMDPVSGDFKNEVCFKCKRFNLFAPIVKPVHLVGNLEAWLGLEAVL